MKHTLYTLTLMAISATLVHSAVTSLSFEEAGTFEANWTQAKGQPNGLSQDLTAGVGASGGLVYALAEGAEPNDVTYIYTAKPVGRFGNGTVSFKFRYDQNDASGNPLYVGLTTTPDAYPSLGGDNFGDWFGVNVGNRSNGTEFRAEVYGYQTDESDGTNTNFRSGAGHPETFVTLVDQTWYEAELTIEDRGNGNWNLTVALHVLNEDGTSVVTENYGLVSYEAIQLSDPELATLPPLSTITDLYRANALYLFVGSQNGQVRGLTAIDDISVDLPPVIDYADPVVFDFDGANALDSWTQVNGLPDSLSVVSDGGVGGSGAIGHTTDPIPEQQFTIGYINETPVGRFGSGYVSAMFKYVDNPDENAGVPFFFGLSTVPDAFLEGAPSAGFGDMFQANIANRSNGTQFRAEIWGAHEGQDFRNGAGHPETFVEFVDNAWYKVTLYIYDNGDGTWNLRSVMDLYNEDGTELVQANFAVNDYEAIRLSSPELATLPELDNFVNISRAPQMYVYFGGQLPRVRGVPAFDNLEVSLPPALDTGEVISTIDFNESTDFPDGWEQVAGLGQDAYIHGADTGIGGSGSVTHESTGIFENTYIWPDAIGRFSSGEISAFFKYENNPDENAGNPFYIGLATRPDFFHSFGAESDEYIKINVANRSNGTQFRAEIYGVGNGTVFRSGAGHPETFVDFVDNAWYKMTLRILEEPDGSVNLISILDLYNEDGTELVQANFKVHDYNSIQASDPERATLPPLDTVLGGIRGAPELYLFFGGQGSVVRGVGSMDQFETVLVAPLVLDYSFFASDVDVELGAPWIHLPTTLGWLYPYNTTSTTGWYYLLEQQAYIYTSPDLYPVMYFMSEDRNEWVAYISDADVFWAYSSAEFFE